MLEIGIGESRFVVLWCGNEHGRKVGIRVGIDQNRRAEYMLLEAVCVAKTLWAKHPTFQYNTNI